MYILKNKLTMEDKALIDLALEGMCKANNLHQHSDQREGAYGGFCDAFTRTLNIVFGETVGAEIYSRYDFDSLTGEEFCNWLDEQISEDRVTVAEALNMDACNDIREVF